MVKTNVVSFVLFAAIVLCIGMFFFCI